MPRRKGSKTTKRKAVGRSTGRKLYLGIGHKPVGHVYGGPKSALKLRQVRRFGEYEEPHNIMKKYLRDHKLPMPNYRKFGVKSRKGGSKSVKLRAAARTNPWLKFRREHPQWGIKKQAAEYRRMQGH